MSLPGHIKPAEIPTELPSTRPNIERTPTLKPNASASQTWAATQMPKTRPEILDPNPYQETQLLNLNHNPSNPALSPNFRPKSVSITSPPPNLNHFDTKTLTLSPPDQTTIPRPLTNQMSMRTDD